MTEPIKSMPLFFIDNQATWPKDAQLAGDIVLWPDDGKYPKATPIALATHPHFEGKIVALAGNRTLILAFCKGAVGESDVRDQLSSKTNPPEQYRLAVDSIIHRVMMHRLGEDKGSSDQVHPFALLQWMTDAHPAEASIIRTALRRLLAHPEGVPYVAPNGDAVLLDRGTVHQQCEQMLDQLEPKAPEA